MSPQKKPSAASHKDAAVMVAVVGAIAAIVVAMINGFFGLFKPNGSPASTPTVLVTLLPTIQSTVIATFTPTTPCPMDMVFIPSGDFWMGAAPNDADAQDDEKPGQQIFLDAFCIAKLEVSNEQYAAFVKDTSHPPPPAAIPQQPDGWIGTVPPPHYEQFPVVRVSWEDALAYCQWRKATLPTEAQWEKAARGTDSRIFPWGLMWDPSRANSGKTPGAAARPVTSFGDGASPYGLLNMSGNVAEWVYDWYDPEGYKGSASRNPTGSPRQQQFRVVRGGSFHDLPVLLRTSARVGIWPARPPNLPATDHIGFRCSDDAHLTP
jgi:formylglycine-generating enzyme required for sulfatase activity